MEGKYIKKKKLLIVTMIIMLGLMVVGYAAFSANLKINGTASVTSTWQILFTNIEEVSKTDGVTIKEVPTASGTSATFNVSLEKPGDSIEYQITVANQGTLDAIIDSITASESGSDAIIFEISNMKIGDTLDANTTKTFSVVISYDESITSQPAITTNELTINIDYVQDTGQTVTVSNPSIEATTLAGKILQDNEIQSDELLDFSKTSATDGTKGLYYTSENTEDNKMTYYFRGAVTNNYVKLGNMYFRVIRINEDGSVRMIYAGTSATATGSAAQIGTSAFNSHVGDNTFVGYMHATPTTYIDGKGSFTNSLWTETTGTVKMSTSYTFDSSTGYYTLVNPVDGYYSEDYYNYYTCRSSTGTTCTLLFKLTLAKKSGTSYQLWGAETHSGYFTTSYAGAHVNEVNSTIKTSVDNWYKNNMTSYTSLLEDSGFCNDRSLYSGTGLGRVTSWYGAAGRNYYKKTPQFSCPSEERDLFTTSSSDKGNKELTYPVGLITADEVVYAGGVYGTSNTNSSYYLYTGAHYWTMSPFLFRASYSYAFEWVVYSAGFLYYNRVYVGLGVRPVINLKSTVEITSGDGTSSNPYTVKVS